MPGLRDKERFDGVSRFNVGKDFFPVVYLCPVGNQGIQIQGRRA
jgi:hypothetical protein